MKSPLTVLVVGHGPMAPTETVLPRIRQVLLGTGGEHPYPAVDFDLLNPADIRVFLPSTGAPKTTPEPAELVEDTLLPNAETASLAENAEATLIILLLAGPPGPASEELMDAWARFSRDRPATGVLAVALGSPERQTIPDTATRQRFTSLGLNDLDERDLRLDILAVHVLLQSLVRLQPETTSRGAPRPRIFFSHAKRDGVPLATALATWTRTFLDLPYFYDTRDLDLSGDVGQQLRNAVSGSLLVALRTEVFDQRYWCQKEVLWAERYGIPALSVDVRWGVQHSPSVVTLDHSPSVRIPDGSLVRILLAALGEALRVQLLRTRARVAAHAAGLPPDSWHVLSRYPGLSSLNAAAETADRRSAAGSSCPFWVVYPNPTMPDELRDDAARLTTARIPNARLVSLDEFRLHCLSVRR